MPSEHSLSSTGLNGSDFGGAPSPSEIEVECDECGKITTADETDGWDSTTHTDTYETTVLCEDCSRDD